MPNVLKNGDTVYYVDYDAATIETGKVVNAGYCEGKLISFGVDFKDDFDEFEGCAFGTCIFKSALMANLCFTNGAPIKEKTNGEVLQSMSYEDLAEFLCVHGWTDGDQKELVEWLSAPTELI